MSVSIEKWIKNTDTVVRTFLGQELAVNEYYEIPRSSWERVRLDTDLAAAVAAGECTVAKDDSGTTDITDPELGKIWLYALDPTCVETEFLDLIPGANNPPHQEGRFFYDPIEKAYSQYNDATDITHQLGQEFLIRVYNNSGAQIDDGKPVYVTGTEVVENRPTIGLARADAATTSKVIGVSTHNIPNNSFGWITHVGLVNGLDTTAYSSGDDLYLDETTAGTYRTTPPPAGNEVVHLGYVIRVHATEGRILIAVGDHQDHPGLTNNPHSVTKSQVGLGNVDNTSDLDKPVSTAQQTALDGKANTSHTHTLVDVTDSGTLAAKNTIATSDIDDDAVTYSKMQNVSATDRILGRDSAGAGIIEEITPAALRTMINVEDGATANDTDANLKARANHTGTQTASTISDFDTEVANNSAVTANTAKVTNATHTGEVTGSNALTVDKTSITNKTTVSLESGDFLLISDTSDTGNLKKIDASEILSQNPSFYSAWLNKDVESNLGMYFDCGPNSNTWIKQTAWMEGDDYGGLVTRSSVPIDNFIAGGDDKIVITGDYTGYFKNDNSVRIINSALNDGMYSIRDDSVLNAGKTEIKIDGDVPDDAATDGDVLLGDFNVTAAGAGWLEITLTMSVNANNFNLWVAFFKNDVQVDQLTSLIHPTGSGDNQIFHMKYYLNCAENDKLDVRFKNDQTNKEGWIEYAQLLFRKL